MHTQERCESTQNSASTNVLGRPTGVSDKPQGVSDKPQLGPDSSPDLLYFDTFSDSVAVFLRTTSEVQIGTDLASKGFC